MKKKSEDIDRVVIDWQLNAYLPSKNLFNFLKIFSLFLSTKFGCKIVPKKKRKGNRKRKIQKKQDEGQEFV